MGLGRCLIAAGAMFLINQFAHHFADEEFEELALKGVLWLPSPFYEIGLWFRRDFYWTWVKYVDWIGKDLLGLLRLDSAAELLYRNRQLEKPSVARQFKHLNPSTYYSMDPRKMALIDIELATVGPPLIYHPVEHRYVTSRLPTAKSVYENLL